MLPTCLIDALSDIAVTVLPARCTKYRALSMFSAALLLLYGMRRFSSTFDKSHHTKISSVDALLISLRGVVAPGASGLHVMTGAEPVPGVDISIRPVLGVVLCVNAL
tara:strand:- start:94 stop:414 length:321 start_codon:yes stop_codon:yes gene_type:complete